jgi:DNA-directed RNA polymerase subunit M/transcription elongation factor TFIIS
MRNRMGTLGPAGDSLRLAEHYRQMTDEELIDLAQHPSELTELAQGALNQEIFTRRLKVPPVEDTANRYREPAPGGFGEDDEHGDEYAQDRRFVELCTVWSHNDALQVQNLLNAADIPFCLGPEKATTADQVTSRFSDGVAVNVLEIGLPWARTAIKTYKPADAPPELGSEEDAGVDIHCPKCHSTDVVLEQLSDEVQDGNSATSEKFDWTCASCGYAWQDDGVEK